MRDQEVKAAVADLFDRAAPTYDAVGVDFFSVFGRRLAEAAALQPGERVLDVGCGRGAVLLPAAEAVGPTGAVVGVDLAPGMVEATARDTAHLPHVLVARADAEHPPARVSAYDAVLAGLLVFFLPDPSGAVRRWAGALRPGGRLALTTFAGDDERWKPVLGELEAHADRADARPSRDGQPKPWDSDEGLVPFLEAAGLVDVVSLTEPCTVVFDEPATWLRWSRSHGMRAAWDAVPPERHADLEVALLAQVERLRDPDGVARLHVAVRVTTARRPAP